MAEVTTLKESGRSGWDRATLAFLAGIAVGSVLFAHVAAVQTPGLDPPPETFAWFVAMAMASVASYLLVRENVQFSHVAAVLTGLVVLAGISVIVSGTYGAAGQQTNPVGPAALVALAAATIFTAAMGWRDGMDADEVAVPSASSR